ncbi:NnrU protein [Salinihabitans flavidus]|uniref:NnrU protein n=1 Tax=Salinihabitans flavidus TaxID=569882 RepID=A0A1H8W6F9_9RHOB|nr:NnrU family protein [Salinihabitans flavidus]SEP23246.1 NnrU protein [Salinihabitans flavidus]
MGWTGFAAVFAAFFLTHSIPVHLAAKSRLVDMISPRRFGLTYTAHLGLSAICLILAFSIAPPNLISFNLARKDTFNLDRPGLVR